MYRIVFFFCFSKKLLFLSVVSYVFVSWYWFDLVRLVMHVTLVKDRVLVHFYRWHVQF
jgi:hypothetical protein